MQLTYESSRRIAVEGFDLSVYAIECDDDCEHEHGDTSLPLLLRTAEVTDAEEDYLAWHAEALGAVETMTKSGIVWMWWPTEIEERQAVAKLRSMSWYGRAQRLAPDDASRWPEPNPPAPVPVPGVKLGPLWWERPEYRQSSLAFPWACPDGGPPMWERPEYRQGWAPVPTAPAGPSASGEALAATDARPEDRRLPVTLREAAQTIWGEREVLARIRQTARARYVGEWALLGAVLAHVACRIGPHVKLPPTIGSAASLNLYVGLVGGSSGGKDAAMDVAAEMFAQSAVVVPVLEPATGQGLEAAYTASTKEGPVQYNDTALFKVSEIGSVSAHASMNASTLMPTLLKMFMAQQLGAAYATEELRRPVRQHGYRAAIVAGIQPAKAELLLNQDAVDAGTAQRWLFMPVNQDEDRSRFAAPDCDAPISWRTPGTGAATLHGWHDRPEWSPCGDQRVGKDLEPVDVKETLLIPICEQARTEVIEARWARNKLGLFEQTMDSIDGHALLTQLKLAALLGLLDGRFEVSDDDWRLARLIMGVSRDTRDICYQVLRSVQSKKNRSRAEFDAEREVAKTEAIERADDDREQKAREKIATRVRHLLGGGDWVNKMTLNQGVAGRDKKVIKLETVLDQMVGTAEIERRTEGRAEQYRLRAR